MTIFIMLGGCATSKQIGQLNMISTRNIDSNVEYKLLKRYVGAENKESSRATTLQEAIDQTVMEVPGGEYLMNARVFLISLDESNYYFAVSGDVWGRRSRKRPSRELKEEDDGWE